MCVYLSLSLYIYIYICIYIHTQRPGQDAVLRPAMLQTVCLNRTPNYLNGTSCLTKDHNNHNNRDNNAL